MQCLDCEASHGAPRADGQPDTTTPTPPSSINATQNNQPAATCRSAFRWPTCSFWRTSSAPRSSSTRVSPAARLGSAARLGGALRLCGAACCCWLGPASEAMKSACVLIPCRTGGRGKGTRDSTNARRSVVDECHCTSLLPLTAPAPSPRPSWHNPRSPRGRRPPQGRRQLGDG